jgi:SAM-dependent methyltransferase
MKAAKPATPSQGASRAVVPPAADWLWQLFAVAPPREGEEVELRGSAFVMRNGILRALDVASAAQEQTAGMFAYKWGKRDTYESPPALATTRDWLVERYGDPDAMSWLFGTARSPLLLDAGCGSGLTALALFGERLRNVRYLGADISTAVEVAAIRFAESGIPGAFLQADLMALPLPDGSVDAVIAEGVLHHSDSTEQALYAVARLLKLGGRILFYVYRRKGPIREFVDDYLRAKLAGMSPESAWNALMPLTRLGEQLGRLNVTVDVPEPIELLEIPAGRYDLQRLIYWHVMKAYYRPDLTLDEMNHINFDWYAPRNAFRQSPEEVRKWCDQAGLVIERERVEEAGITIVAVKRG